MPPGVAFSVGQGTAIRYIVAQVGVHCLALHHFMHGQGVLGKGHAWPVCLAEAQLVSGLPTLNPHHLPQLLKIICLHLP